MALNQSTASNARTIVGTELVTGVMPAAISSFFMHMSANSMKGIRAQHQSNVVALNRNPRKPTLGNLNVSGSLGSDLDAELFGFFLMHAIGVPLDVAGANVGTFVHTYKIGSAMPAGMFIETQLTDQPVGNFTTLHQGNKVSALNITVPQEGMATYSLDLVGISESKSATTVDAAPIDLGHEGFGGFDVSISINNLPSVTLSDASISIANAVDESSYVIDGSGGIRGAVPLDAATATGSLNGIFTPEMVLIMDNADTNTPIRLEIIYSRGLADGSLGNESLSFLLPEVTLEKSAPDISGAGGLKVAVNFTSFYKSSVEATAFQVTLLNEVPTYII